MNLPTHEQCLALFETYRVPSNIVAHCKKVCAVGTFLATALAHKGVPVNIELTARACLLHDLMKAVVFDDISKPLPALKFYPTPDQIKMHAELRKKYAGMHEEVIAHELLHAAYPELAIVIRGTKDAQGEHDTARMPIEEKIKWYSDWRLFVDEIVTLDERAAEAYERKKQKLSKILPNWVREIEKAKLVEKELFSHLDFSPEQLKEKVKKQNVDKTK